MAISTKTVATEEEIKNFINKYKKEIFSWSKPYGVDSEGNTIENDESAEEADEQKSPEYIFATKKDIGVDVVALGDATIDSVNIISSANNYSYTLSANKQIVYMTSVMNSAYIHDNAMKQIDTVNYTVNYSNGLSITRTVNARLLTVGEALQLTQEERKYNDLWWLADYEYCEQSGTDDNYFICADIDGFLSSGTNYYNGTHTIKGDMLHARLGFPIQPYI